MIETPETLPYPHPTPWLVTVAQAAEILAVSTRTVRSLVATGQLDSVKVGGSRRIWLADLKRFAGK